MEKPIFRQENLLQIYDTIGTFVPMKQDMFMIFDFTHTCKTYDKTFYKKESFAKTRCPKCPAIGRFSLHGSYSRHVIYFEKFELIYTLLEIKRVKCKSCKSTHAVMPGDLVPYRLLSLFVVIFILVSFYIEKVPVLKMAKQWDFSFQFIYSIFKASQMHANNIYQYFRETAPRCAPPAHDLPRALALIKKQYATFQLGYLELNRRPCFMCKFFYRGNPPPTGPLASPNAPRGAST